MNALLDVSVEDLGDSELKPPMTSSKLVLNETGQSNSRYGGGGTSESVNNKKYNELM